MSIFTKPPMFKQTNEPKLKTPHVSIEGIWGNIEQHIVELEQQGWHTVTIIDDCRDGKKTRVELDKS